MGVTHIMRADEFISSTPKFMALYEALDIKRPFLVTLPPIMGPDGKKKLGKRDGAKDFLGYKKEGYLPEAMLNFLAFIGWNPGGDKEIFSTQEFIDAFSIEGIHISGGKFNEEKLDWINKEHIKKLSKEKLQKSIFEWLPNALQIEKIIPIITERISKFSDIKVMLENHELDFFYKEPEYSKEKLLYKNTEAERTKNNLNEVLEALRDKQEDHFTKENVKNILMMIADKKNNRGEVLHPVRFALSGLDKSPDPFILIEILGKEVVIKRLNKAISML